MCNEKTYFFNCVYSCNACFLWPVGQHWQLAITLFITLLLLVSMHDDVIKWKHFPHYWPFHRWSNNPVTGEFPSQRPVTRGFDVFFDLRLNKQLSKQSWGWWFETPSRSLWRHYNRPRSSGRWLGLIWLNIVIYNYIYIVIYGYDRGLMKSFIRWHHDMETFSTFLAFCAGNPPVTEGFSSQRGQ